MPGRAADAVPAGMENFYRQHYEVRLGGFAHSVGGNEKGSFDVNAELVFPQFWYPTSFPNWLVPRLHTGAMINTDHKTSYGYIGGLWTYDITPRVFAEAFLGGALHDGNLHGTAPDRNALGCRILFHSGGSLGYRLTPNWSVMFTFDHLSNGNAVLHGCSNNQGLNEYGVRVGYSW